jgi:hypothetical protein
MDDDWDVSQSWTGRLPVNWRRMARLLPAMATEAGFRDLRLYEDEGIATASRKLRAQHMTLPSRSEESALWLRWVEGTDDSNVTDVQIAVYQEDAGPARRYDKQAAEEVGKILRRFAANLRPPQKETVLGPGEPHFGHIAGTLRDYSGCATADDVIDLQRGTLPLGKLAFGKGATTVQHHQDLYLSTYANGELMESRGALICAPTGSGKTELIVSWAKAANAAGYCVLIVDVKGNMRSKLGNLQGDCYRLSTDPYSSDSDRVNFLRELEPRTSVGHDRIRQFAEVLLPNQGWRGAGGDDEMRYQQRLVNLTAFIHMLKLRELYYPKSLKPAPRKADLGDLYDLVFNEQLTCTLIKKLQAQERIVAERAVSDSTLRAAMPRTRVEHWAQVLGPMLDPNKLPEFGARRDSRFTYTDYVRGIILALEPFAGHGTLRRKIRDVGSGSLFSMSDLNRRIKDQKPATILLETREQDGEIAWTVLALALKSLQPLIFQRWNLDGAKKQELRPILLLLDESRRLRDFRGDEYITLAREARAGCVLVYQNLDQVEEQLGRAGLNTILENVGTQIYLHSLVGNTAEHFIRLLPERYRTIETVNRSDGSIQARTELIPYFTKLELAELPSGRYPGILMIRGRNNNRPILVDMDRRRGS